MCDPRLHKKCNLQFLDVFGVSRCYTLDMQENTVKTAASFFKEGYGALATQCAAYNWRLYYMRPKVHLQMHIVQLGKGIAASCALLCVGQRIRVNLCQCLIFTQTNPCK
jgi:hypothetical protein